MKTGIQAALAVTAGMIVQVAVGQSTSGSLSCFGLGQGTNELQYDFGQSVVPEWLGPCTAVAAGGFHTVAIRVGGAIHAWGANYYGQLGVPGDAMPASKIVCGVNHTVALTTAGHVAAWGMNIQGQSAVPPDLGACIEIGAGGIHSLAVRSSGQIRGWGFNMNGQTVPPADLGPAVAVAGMYLASAALLADGTIRVWGSAPPVLDAGPFASITATAWSDRIYAIRQDGSVASNYPFEWSLPPSGSGPFRQIHSYSGHTLGIELDGDLVVWGGGGYGQSDIPQNVCGGIMVAAGFGHSVVLFQDIDGDLVCDIKDACPSIVGPMNVGSPECNGCPWAASPDCLLAFGDLNADYQVDGGDLGIMLSIWGSASPGGLGNLNGDSIVDGADLGVLLSRWGPVP
jgi:hypothetical protein